MSSYSIGRKPENDVSINQPQISGQHAVLHQISDGTFLLEDIDSSGGTYVKNIRIKRKIVTVDDTISFANLNYPVRKLLELAQQKDELEQQMPNVMPGFAMLRQVYIVYELSRNSIEKKTTIKNEFIKAAGSAIPIVGSALAILVSHLLSNKEKITALEAELRLNYTCPSCRRFLGFNSWDNLYSNGKCAYCNYSWFY